MIAKETLVLTVEADVPADVLSQIDAGTFSWTVGTTEAPIELSVTRSEEGEGFGLTEVLTVVISIAGAAASDLVADAIRSAVRGVIRRVRISHDQSDGSAEEIAKLVDRHRQNPSEVTRSPR
jgi:hypothetical protein